MPPHPQPAKQAAARAYNAFQLVSFTIGAKATNTITATVALTDPRGMEPLTPVMATVYLSDSADGSTLTATALTSNIAIHSKGQLLGTPTTEKCVQVLSDATGTFDLDLTQTASPQAYYLVVVLPDGSIVVSNQFTF